METVYEKCTPPGLGVIVTNWGTNKEAPKGNLVGENPQGSIPA